MADTTAAEEVTESADGSADSSQNQVMLRLSTHYARFAAPATMMGVDLIGKRCYLFSCNFYVSNHFRYHSISAEERSYLQVVAFFSVLIAGVNQ